MINTSDLRVIGLKTRIPSGSTLSVLVLVFAALLALPQTLQAQTIPSQERQALIALYDSTRGPNWNRNTGWLGAKGTECSWYGVTCNATNVTVLALRGNQLVGSIPLSLGDLTSLKQLDLYGNQLSGSMPSQLGNLTDLTDLDLSGNQLSGGIPESLSSLTNLNDLRLFTNQLSGSIPTSLGNLTNLTVLRLHNNQLSGSIPSSLGNLISLSSLNLGQNLLSGNIPEVFGRLANLTDLNLYENRLSGSIPESLGNLINLTGLFLFSNQLSGSIPESLGSMSNLQHLVLDSNQLSGSIPGSLGNLTKLTHLFLTNNQLSGGIPPFLVNLTNLRYLFLSNNPLSGSIPSFLGSMSNLQYLDLGGNQLSGSIPPELMSLTGLKFLFLGNNLLSGGIPAFLGNLTNLAVLRLEDNRLSGSIPSELGNLTSLTSLYLDGNALCGSIPLSLINLTKLTNLDLSRNALYATDASLLAFLGSKSYGWQDTQTVAPTNLSAIVQSDSSILLSWSPILYTGDAGSYQVYLSTNSGGPFILAGLTVNKSSSSFALAGLLPSRTYYMVVQTVTGPNTDNQNTVISEYSAEVLATPVGSPTPVSITIETNPTGRGFMVDGTAYSSTQTFSWSVGDTHTVSTSTPQAGSTGTRYVFDNWSDGGMQSHSITASANATTYRANFIAQYQLTVLASPAAGGTVNASPASADRYYASGTLVQLTAVENNAYYFSNWSGDLTGTVNPQTVTMSGPHSVTAILGLSGSSVDFALSPGGTTVVGTTGSSSTIRTGYASMAVISGAAPYATVVLTSMQNGVTVSEAGIPSSPPTTSARIFIDYRTRADALPGRREAGTIDINTGIAVVNCGSAAANVTYFLRDINGKVLAIGHGTIAAGSHFAKYIDKFKEVASDFDLPSNFPSAIQFASLEISADQPLSILALRMTVNQREEAVYTTTPVANLMHSLSYRPIYFPQLVDGGGYTTSLILLNTSEVTESGILQILDNNGAPLIVSRVGGTEDSSFRYSIPAGGIFRFQTDGLPMNTRAGWLRLEPDFLNPTPVGAGLFGYYPAGILVSESGIHATVPTKHARVYVDISGSHNTGLAIANVGLTPASIEINAFQPDGITAAGTNQTLLQLAIGGHDAKFADEFIRDLPQGFRGVLDLSSMTPFAALTLRSLSNERHDFLMTSFPIADVNRPAPSPIVFPHIQDGGGYTTEFILINTDGAVSMKLYFWDEKGMPWDMGK